MDNENKTPWLERPIHPALPAISNEVAIFAAIMIFAVITRFYNLGARVMSHDEGLHTYFSWLLYRGQGYQHTPMMHGPWQFHWIALSYFLFGPSDFTARIPAALFSIATIWLVWYWRRYLGNAGALIAAFLMVVSPFMLYYGRYVREDVYTGFSGLLMLYAILRYMESGSGKYLYLLSGALIIHFADKETSFIYALQAFLYLAIYFFVKITREPWKGNEKLFRTLIIALAAGALLLGTGAALTYVHKNSTTISSTETAAPANPTATQSPLEQPGGGATLPRALLALGALILMGVGITYFVQAYVWHNISKERSFDLMILIGTFVFPMSTGFPLQWFRNRLGITVPTDSASVNALDAHSLTVIALFVMAFFAISIFVGMLWNRDWWKYAALFWGVYTILFTTVFTNAAGFFTGVVGSLSYWLVQQGVQRGSQPWYYYIAIQIPMYEFLPALGAILAIFLGVRRILAMRAASGESEVGPTSQQTITPDENQPASMFGFLFGLLIWWSITSIISLTLAGERMPWLTYHMAWPLILLTGWAIGQIVEMLSVKLRERNLGRSTLSILVLAVFILAAFNSMRALYGATPPFQGTQLIQLQATAAFLLPLISVIFSGVLLAYLMKDDLTSLGIVALFLLALVTLTSSVINGATYLSLTSDAAGSDPALVSASVVKFIAGLIALVGSIAGIVYLLRLPRLGAFLNLFVLTAFALLLVQTIRTSFRASYILYDDAMEYLVYAHGATAIKDVMSQVTDISERTAGGLNAVIAYDASAPDTGVSWPFVWYLRNFTALRSFDQPTRSLRDAVAVIVDQKNFDKIEAALGNNFYRFDYIRMWWPNQDYFNLDRARLLNAITNPQIREGIFDVWFNRDYTRYAQATGSSSMTLSTWQPADEMRLYVRRDVAAQIWKYGVGPVESPAAADPYQAGTTMIPADVIFGSERFPPKGLNAPRAIAIGHNNDFYVADSRNHRIIHFGTDGNVINEWGSFADQQTGNAPIGTFNEPWGVAVAPDGSVYVTDTWNHRVQKFTADGKPILMWGQYGQPVPDVPESKSSFWGPRGIAVDTNGHVYVADTGNKRIVVFDSNGKYISEFGSAGMDPGQFDEPVGVAVAADGTIYVSDTWNQRVQSFIPSQDGTTFAPLKQWDVNAWFGQSVDNKPFIAVDANNHVYITDPEGYRVIEFTNDGTFVRAWGDFGSGPDEIGLASGVAVDANGSVWVTDAGNNRILKYTIPQ